MSTVSGDESSTSPTINIREVIDILRDPKSGAEQDAAYDTVDLLNPSYQDDLPLLFSTARDDSEENNESFTRMYAINAILSIEPHLGNIVPLLIELLSDKDDFIRSLSAVALRKCSPDECQLAVPVLVAMAKDWRLNTTVGIQGTAFVTLVKIVGLGKALKLLL